ncbi:MAG: phospho-sugar mutase [Streptosporangiales bacterium]|nr:phospho-sugar mutase [Streptosporangiales bacterium]
MSNELVDRARAWLAEDPDPRTQVELRGILDGGDRDALVARFGERLQFGTAGLRGELGAGPNRMNRVTVMRAAAGLAAYLTRHSTGRSGRSAVVGYDARHYSGQFARDSAAVLAGAGLRALVLPRPLPTPVLAFAVRHLGADAGVMVTASHNPPRDNGYKVYLGDGRQIAPPADLEISAAIDAVGPLAGVPLDGGWETVGDEVVDSYLDAVCRLPLGSDRDVSVAYTPLHGVGRDVLAAAFARAGFPEPYVVAEQAEPDPDFPTVAFPNPEEPGAMDLVLAAGGRVGADLVIANDPDADRCAVAVPDGGRMRQLTGDELGCLLAEHVLAHTSGADRLVVTTIVSSSLLAKIAAAHGVRYAETLTGFKWITRADELSGTGGRFVYGYEEALGYCVAGDALLEGAPPVRDKDGIGAALAAAGLAAAAKRAGRTLPELLDAQARRYGLHATSQLTIPVHVTRPAEDAMVRVRERPPSTLGGRRVEAVEDLLAGAGGAGLPPTDALRYRLGGRARVVVRPSGTEPKLKAYLEVVTPVTGRVEDARSRAAAELAALRRDVTRTLRP